MEEIRRLVDSTGAGGPIHRFRLTVRRDADQARLQGDSTPLKVRQSIREDDTFTWHQRDGLLRRDRHITVETYVPTEARVRRPVQARIEQRVVLERIGQRPQVFSKQSVVPGENLVDQDIAIFGEPAYSLGNANAQREGIVDQLCRQRQNHRAAQSRCGEFTRLHGEDWPLLARLRADAGLEIHDVKVPARRRDHGRFKRLCGWNSCRTS